MDERETATSRAGLLARPECRSSRLWAAINSDRDAAVPRVVVHRPRVVAIVADSEGIVA